MLILTASNLLLVLGIFLSNYSTKAYRSVNTLLVNRLSEDLKMTQTVTKYLNTQLADQQLMLERIVNHLENR